MKKLGAVLVAVFLLSACGQTAAQKAVAKTAAAASCSAEVASWKAALQNVDGHVRAGISFFDYKRLVGEVATASNSFSALSPVPSMNCLVEVAKPFARATDDYAAAVSSWQSCFTDVNCLNTDASYKWNKITQAKWQDAAHQLVKGEQALAGLAGS